MPGRADLTSRTNAALRSAYGSGFCHCVEMEFGTTVKDRGDGVGDTSIAWAGVALDGVQVFTSLDDGDSWQPVATSGDPIPYQALSVNLQNPPIVPVPVGWVTTGKSLQVRVLFLNGAPSAVLTSLTIHIGYEDGTTFDETLTGASLAADADCVLAHAGSGGLTTFPDMFLHLDGNGAGLIYTGTDPQGGKGGFHLSDGGGINFDAGQGGAKTWVIQDPDTNDVGTNRSFSITEPMTITVPGGVCTLTGTDVGVGIAPGQPFQLLGFSNPQNNGYWNAATVTNDVITITQTTLVAEGPVTATMKATRTPEVPTTGNRFEQASMSFEGWFYPETTDGYLLTFSALSLDAVPEQIYDCNRLELVGTSDTAAKLAMHIRDPSTEVFLNGQQVFTLATADDYIPLNTWTHVAFSYDGFWATLYVNGLVVAHSPLASPYVGGNPFGNPLDTIPLGIVIQTNGQITMGRSAVTPANAFTGRLSEWRFYAGALTAGKVLRRMFRRLDPNELQTLFTEDQLSVYLPMNDGAGRVVADQLGATLGTTPYDLQFDQIQPAHGDPVGFQGGWLPDQTQVWRGYEVSWPPTLGSQRAPGCQTTAINIDPLGDIVRLTDALANVTFADAREFIAVGGCGQIEAIQEAGDLVPTGVRLTLSGIQPQHLSLALSVRYLDRPCRVYQLMWDGDGTQLDEFLIFEGKMDVMAVSLGQTASVQVSAESQLTNWRRPRNLHWSDAGHRAIWPDDNGFEFLDQMVDLEVWWPVRVGPSASSGG